MKLQHFQIDDDTTRTVRFQLHFDPRDVTLQNTPFGIRILMKESFPAGEPGGPAFPAKVIRVVLPSFTVAERIAVSVKESTSLVGEPVVVAPFQKPQPGAKSRKIHGSDEKTALHYNHDTTQLEASQTCINDRFDRISSKKLMERKFEVVEEFALPPLELPKQELYEAAFKNPAPEARIITTEQAGPNSVALIEIKPVRYDKQGGLELCTNLEITVYCTNAATQEKGVDKAFFRSGLQAGKIMGELRLKVINPDFLVDWVVNIPYFFQYEYIVITDNYNWDANSKTKGAFIGDQISEFQRLVDWKRKRGLTARVVTITDIVAGVYGNHVAGARDLQEVIRNFMKWALKHWNISWALLGGDINILPVRNAPGASEGHISVQTANNPPGDNQSFWTGTFLKMKVVNPGTWWPGSWPHQLVNAATGELIPYDAAGASNATNPGWYYCTNDSYSTRTPNTTQFVRVNGPAVVVNGTLQWLYEWNTIPTDFYYSSLVGPNYDLPGLHDWDLLNNGIYGQHTNDADFDGVNYFADVSVGRAPVSSVAEAQAFVNKVIAYEQLRDPSGVALNTSWLNRMALVSSNWGGRWWLSNDNNNPPADFHFHHTAAQNFTIIKLPSTGFNLDFNYNVLAYISETDVRVLPYNDAGGRGWYYCQGANNPAASGFIINLPFFHYFYPIPTPWIAVRGASEELTPQNYILDSGDADGSMLDQEELRRQIDTELPVISDFTRLYEDEVDLSSADRAAAPVAVLSTPGLQTTIDSAQHFLSLSGHGYSGGCCAFSHGVVGASTNGYQTFVAFADSCLTNQFDANDAVSESAVNHANGGAVAYIGNSRFSWIGVGDNFQRAFFHQMTTARHLGHLNDTRVGMVNEGTGYWRLYNKWVIYAQNLMGDPEMPVWTSTPLKILVEIPLECDIRQLLTFFTHHRILFLDVPLSGVHVHLQQGASSRSSTTDGGGLASLNLTGLSEGPCEITFTKLGYKPVIGTINILVPAWVKGVIKFIHHQEYSPTTTDIGLQIGTDDSAFLRVFRATQDLPDYDIIMDAATDAFVSEKSISFFVNSNRENGRIERFRFDAELPETGA